MKNNKILYIILSAGIFLVVVLCTVLIIQKVRINKKIYMDKKEELENLINENDSLNNKYNDLDKQLKDLQQTIIN